MLRRTLAIGIIATAAWLTPSLAADGLTPVAKRVAAKEFSVVDAQGRTITLGAWKGRVVLLDFWATWCTGCKEEMPWFMEFQSKYASRGLASIGVSLDEDGWTSVRPYLATHPVNYPIAVADLDFAKRYGVQGALPVTVVIDRAGRIAEVHHGKVSKDAFEARIRLLLAEK
jgi:peroxiredoxin